MHPRQPKIALPLGEVPIGGLVQKSLGAKVYQVTDIMALRTYNEEDKTFREVKLCQNRNKLVEECSDWLDKTKEEIDNYKRQKNYEKSHSKLQRAESNLARALARLRDAIDEET